MRRNRFKEQDGDIEFRFNFRFWYVLFVLALAAGVVLALKKYFPQDAWDAIKATYMHEEPSGTGE